MAASREVAGDVLTWATVLMPGLLITALVLDRMSPNHRGLVRTLLLGTVVTALVAIVSGCWAVFMVYAGAGVPY